MHSLLDAGLVDELRMLVCPTSRGRGTRIFEHRQELKPVEATSGQAGGCRPQPRLVVVPQAASEVARHVGG
jgi:riboflavin biosynthesis pyrimidine reductase